MTSRSGKIIGAAAAACISAAAFAGPASAQGLFDFLFKSPFERRASPPAGAPQDYRNGYAPEEFEQPRGEGPQISGGTGRYTAYCVRLCDGKYFPLSRGGAQGSELCNSFCPATKTKVFSGTEVSYAAASDGTRYQDLENAFLYRQRTVESCTCNGTDPYGLAKIDIKNDPTARRGDLVATTEGVKKLTDVSSKRTAQAMTDEESRPQRRPRPPANPFSFLFR